MAWVRNGQGMVRTRVAASAQFRGAERFSRAQRWAGRWWAQAQVQDSSGIPGAGPVAFASFTFDDDADGSVVVIPRTIVGCSEAGAWRTDVWSDAGGDPLHRHPTGIGDLITDDRRPGLPATRWEDDQPRPPDSALPWTKRSSGSVPASWTRWSWHARSPPTSARRPR